MSHSERRQHPRHQATYSIEVSTEIANGTQVSTSGSLQDISDSGVSFACHKADIFHIGQKVDVSILAVLEIAQKQSLHAKGEIMWIEHSEFAFNQALIGLHLDELIESVTLIQDD